MFFSKKSSRNNIKFDELRSWTQKAIRRGDTDQAYFCAEEFNIDGYGNAVWNILKLIATEDIGVAEYSAVSKVNQKYNEWLDIVKNNNKLNKIKPSLMTTCCNYPAANKLLYSTAVYLANCKKSRMLPLICYLYLYKIDAITSNKSTKIETGSLNHTQQIKILFKKHLEPYKNEWKYISTSVFSDCEFENVKKIAFVLFILLSKKATAKGEDLMLTCLTYLYYWKYHQELIAVFKYTASNKNIDKLVNNINDNIELFNKTSQKLYIYQSAVTLFRFEQLKDPCTPFVSVDVLSYKITEVPDYVLDKHTGRGKQLKRGLKHFLEVGAKIVNLNDSVVDNYSEEGIKAYLADEKEYGTRNARSGKLLLRKQQYFEKYQKVDQKVNKKRKKNEMSENTIKRQKPNKTEEVQALREDEIFENPIRAQTPTSLTKPDTYYAVDISSGKSVFVKGPYKNKKFADIQVDCDKIKQLINTLTKKLTPKEIYLLNNNGSTQKIITPVHSFIEGREFSIHNDYQKQQPYVIMNDLCDYKQCSVTKHSSKTFGELSVINKKTSNCQPADPSVKYTDSVQLQLLSHLAFRYIMEINDTCNGNIMVDTVKNKVYSVDENNYMAGKRPCLFKKYPTDSWVALINSITNRYSTYMSELMSFWTKCFSDPCLIEHCKDKNIDLARIRSNIQDLSNKEKFKQLFIKTK